jgi:hypothetical protein
MINEILVLQFFLLVILYYFFVSINVILLWYLAGLYLFFLGLLILAYDGSIFIGFLWIIDLGVGLIFFIFILHFSNFLYQKTHFYLTEKTLIFSLFLLLFLVFFSVYIINIYETNVSNFFHKTWIWYVSWYNYYEYLNLFTITELNLLRELYFYNNSLEFFIINFVVIYGVFAAICLSFLIKKIFIFLNLSQFLNYNLIQEVNSYFYIRNQNFIKQQNTPAGVRVWNKKKYLKI